MKPVPLAIALLVSGAAIAQEEVQLEKVIVTAQKRAEPLQEVPVSVKAFTSKQVEDAGIKTTQDFINMTPNVSFENSYTYGNSFVAIRGVNQINNADSPVAVVVDGVPQSNQKQLKMNLFDIQRIEVLKGPQGALYGRNAIGGAIVIDTKNPGNKTEGFAGLDIGNGNTRSATAGVSGAIVEDKLLFRLVAQGKKSDGLINNTYLNTKSDFVDHDNSVRGKLLYNASPDLKIDLRASYTDISAGAVWDSVIRNSGPQTITSPTSNLLGSTKGRTSDASLKFDWDTAIGTVTAISSYTNLIERYRGDLDFTNANDPEMGVLGDPAWFDLPPRTQFGQGQDLSVRMKSQELRITSPGDQPLRWIGGAYYLHTDRHLYSNSFIDLNGSLAQFHDPSLSMFVQDGVDDNAASAVFGQIDYDITPQTTIAAALRYDRDQRKQTDLSDGSQRAATFSNWQPKVTVTQKFTPDELGYVTYSTGFRSGGFNAPGYSGFRPETLKNLEAGLKSTLFNRRLFFNVALFTSESKDYQFFYVTNTAAQVISNIEKVRMNGADVDFNWLVIKGLTVDGGLGVTLSKIKSDSKEPAAVGNYTPNATPWKFTLGVQREWPAFDRINGFVRADYEHRSKKYWDPDNVAQSPSQNLVGLRFGLRDVNDKWSVMFAGRNLTNARYYSDYGSAKYFGSPAGIDTGSLAPPRTFGIESTIRF
ncbi:TonB-dependent receptor [Duganella sp. FT135W]|uniref:TonB-dependent receptor n=1 Tax=Duganella flavida TaxID=2692175 RepID=A0A6L8KDZ0_9BURK|nr:TonB-dependent receptor [Duganella flavida]MYM25596.1 TonB-dependent receptor [Duganella flavida]